MAWVRIEDAVTEHRKHLKAGPAAAWLWVCGIAYCQRQLSDGFIPVEAVPLLGVPRGFSRLIESLVEVGLFDRVEGGYLVHDYHDFNDTRQEALTRKADLSAKRSAAGRLGGLKGGRGRQANEANAQQHAQANTKANDMHVAEAKIGPIPSHPIPIQKKERTNAPPKEPADPSVREFLLWFQEEFKSRRNGADCLIVWERDGAIVKRLLKATSLERLKRLAAVLLEATADEFINNSDRGIPILSTKFNWLSDRLATWEAKKQNGAA